METDILMSESKLSFQREKAVRTSAELLRNSGIAFFPLDIRRMLKSSFSRQIRLIPYKNLDAASLREGADETADPTYGISTITSPAFRNGSGSRSCMSWDMFFLATINCSA